MSNDSENRILYFINFFIFYLQYQIKSAKINFVVIVQVKKSQGGAKNYGKM